MGNPNTDASANSAGVRAWGFGINGVDSLANRTGDLRNGFAHYSGHNPASTPLSLGTGNRRRLVVLQGVAGGLDSSGNVLPQWRILYNAQLASGFPLAENSSFRAAINSVFPAAVAQDFDAWKTAQNIPAALNGPFQDADGDGDENIKEFYFATVPTDATSRSQPVFAPAVASGYTYVFRRAKGITGVNMKLRCSENLTSWVDVTLTGANTSVVDMTTYEEVTVTLPASVGKRFYRIELTE